MSDAALDSRAQCAGEIQIGYAPLSYFLLGCLELLVCAFLVVVIVKRNFVPSVQAATRVNFLLPVYLTVVIFLVSLGVLMGIDRIVGFYPTNVLVTIVRWFILRSCTEGLSVFFMHAGIGFSSIKKSILIGSVWSLVNTVILLVCLLVFSFEVFVILCIIVAFTLTVYYAVLWLTPYSLLHRRPAASTFSLLNMVMLIVQIATIISYLAGHHLSNSRCAVELIFSIVEFLQLAIMLYAFLLDSMFWQGLYTDERTNLNAPMLGMWDMNDRNTVKMVTESIAHLERKVVYIIPFSQLRVDTSKFFSGGSARVYRGMYQDMEVAIKFLFCMELTPGRVVEFCNEATLLNSLQHDNIVHCHGVAIMPPAISLVTEFCTYGSLFDFLHSMDWMVTDERLSGFSGLSGTTQSYLQERMSQNGHPSLASSTTGGTSVGKAAPIIASQGSPLVELQGTVGSNPLNLNVLPPQTSDAPVWHNFTQLATPPPSPAPSPAMNYLNANHKRINAPGLVSQLFTSRQQASDRRNNPNNTSDPDLEAGGNELHGLNTGTQNSSGSGGAGSPGSKLRTSVSSSGSGSLGNKGSSSTDLASKLADALSSHYSEPEHGRESRSDNGRGSWSNSFRNNPSNEMFENRARLGSIASRATTATGTKRGGAGATAEPQLQSATSILLTRELGYGMGPNSKRNSSKNHSINYTVKSISGAHNSISGLGNSHSIPSVLLSCISSSVHSLGRLLPTTIKLRMAKECCAGVMYLHSKNIMHCDIKSLNFLVTSNLTVKLADLGEARFFHDTDPRKLPRNINWSSPEILMDLPSAQIRASADIWSLAMVISEICNGEVPYDAQECRQMGLDNFIAHLKEGHRPVLSKEFAHLTWLNELLESAWSFDADDRCTSAEMYLKFVENIG